MELDIRLVRAISERPPRADGSPRPSWARRIAILWLVVGAVLFLVFAGSVALPVLFSDGY